MNDRIRSSALSRSVAVKARLDHPVIDTDVHTVEFGPLFEDYIAQYGGAKIVDQFRARFKGGFSAGPADWYNLSDQQRRDHRVHRPAYWVLPAKNTLDLATVSLPRLLAERLEEAGTDFGVVYPNVSLFPIHSWREDLRRTLVRASNHYHADVFKPYSDRLTPVASIPLHNPQEGIEELEFAVNTLGLKSAIIPGGIHRPIKAIADRFPFAHHPDIARVAQWYDTFGIDSEYDYDPFWAKAAELKVPLTTHTSGQGWTGRASISNYMYNHIGHFSDASEAFVKSLFFGGVTRRFPQLRFGLLEGNGSWGSDIYVHLHERFEKRNRNTVHNYNPANVDGDLLHRLYQEYGSDLFRGKHYSKEEIRATAFGVTTAHRSEQQPPEYLDDFAKAGIEEIGDIKKRFVDSFYFGVESDDRTVALAFNDKVNFGTKLNAFWSSDVGHWDVVDFTETLAQSWDLVDQGVLSAEDFKAFVFGNPHRFYTEANPDFFKGTVIEQKLAAVA